jgi:hypothetical protein
VHDKPLPQPADVATLKTLIDSDDPVRAALAALLTFHGLRSGQILRLHLTDLHDGRLHLDGRAIPLAALVQQKLAAWLDYRNRRWPATAQLAEIIRQQQDAAASPNLHLLDALPQAAIDLTRLPEDHQRELYDAFHLQIRYNALTYEVILRVTVDADTAQLLATAVNRVVGLPRPRTAPEAQEPGAEAHASAPGKRVCNASRAPGGSRTTRERAAAGDNMTFVVIDGTWPLPPKD